MKQIYEAIEAVLGTKYPVGWQYMDEQSTEVVGIYVYESSNDSRYADGEYEYESIKVHVQINCASSEVGIQEALDYLRAFVDKMEDTYVDTTDIEFVDCKHVGPKAIPIGKNGYNIPMCRSVVDIKYLLKG